MREPMVFGTVTVDFPVPYLFFYVYFSGKKLKKKKKRKMVNYILKTADSGSLPTRTLRGGNPRFRNLNHRFFKVSNWGFRLRIESWTWLHMDRIRFTEWVNQTHKLHYELSIWIWYCSDLGPSFPNSFIKIAISYIVFFLFFFNVESTINHRLKRQFNPKS